MTEETPSAKSPYGGISPELFDRLAPYLTESIAVVNAEGRVRTLLGPPGGLLGPPQGTELSESLLDHHIFEYCEPDDLPSALELAVEALASAPGWAATRVVRLRDRNGGRGRYEVRIENREDDPVIDGFVVRLRALRERDADREATLQSELGNGLEFLAGSVPLPIAFIGSDARLFYLNEAAREFCGALVPALDAEGLGALSSGPGRAEIERAVATLVERPGELTVVVESEVRPGERRVVEVRIRALGPGSRVLAMLATMLDVTTRQIEESELRRRASSDPLTGLHNRIEVEDALLARLESGARRVGVLYVDLDRFKAVNDTFGHDAGDDFLVEVAVILRNEVRTEDLVGRLGGDEFVVIVDLAEEDGSNGRATLEGLALRVERSVARFARAAGLEVTASVGPAVGHPGDTPRAVLRRADRAMYAVKHRNRLSANAN